MNGAGTLSNPWQITNETELKQVNAAGYYKVMNDFTVYSGKVCANLPSGAHVDGAGHTVGPIFLTDTANACGLFKQTQSGSTIKDLYVAAGNSISGGAKSGVFVGIHRGLIERCGVFYRGTTDQDIGGGTRTGGFVGSVEGGTIRNSFSGANAYNGNGNWVGNFAGGMDSGAIEYCETFGRINSSPSTSVYRGGFIGQYAGGSLLKCAWTTGISVNSLTYGLGNSQSNSEVYGLTSSQMKVKTNAPFTSWNFTDQWNDTNAGINNGYFMPKFVVPLVESRTVTSFMKQIFSDIFGLGIEGRAVSSHVAKIESDVSTSRQATVEVGSFMKAINAVALKTNPKYIVSSFVNKINSSIGTLRKATVEIKSTAGTIKSNVSSNRIATVSGSSYVRQIESEASNGRKFRAEAVAFISPLDAKAQISVKVVAKSYMKRLHTESDLEGNNFKVLRSKVRKIRASATPFRNHIVVLESFMRGIRTFASTQIKDKILAKLNLNTDWTDKVIVGDTIKITLDIESKSGSQAHVIDGTLKIMDSEKNVLVTYELGDLEEISFGIYELLYTVPDGYGPLYAEFTALTDEYPIATRLKLDRQWV